MLPVTVSGPNSNAGHLRRSVQFVMECAALALACWRIAAVIRSKSLFQAIRSRLTSITAFHEGVGSTGPSSDSRKSPPRVSRNVIAEVDLKLLFASVSPLLRAVCGRHGD